MKVTRHNDRSISIRLRRHGNGTDEPSLEDILHALSVAQNGFETMAHKYPAEAEDYRRLAAHYQRLRTKVIEGAGR